MQTGIMREREANRVGQRVLARTIDEVEYYYRVARPGQSLVDNQARIEGIYKYFSLSTPDYFYWRLELRRHPIFRFCYENIDDICIAKRFL